MPALAEDGFRLSAWAAPNMGEASPGGWFHLSFLDHLKPSSVMTGATEHP